jgi:glyoxylase-like metal-dependent hydrolase (beta-lactamase superfamily II)
MVFTLAPSAMQRISPHLYQISMGGVNVFIVADETGLTLVDTGYKGSADKIFAALRKAGHKPEDLRQIILTHAHPDHSGSALAIQQQLGIPVWAHADDAQLMAQGQVGRLPFHRSPGLANWLVFQLFIKGSPRSMEPLVVARTLHDGELLPLAGGIRVVHTPGHSLGHIVLILEKEGILIAGDLCANMLGLDLSTVYEDRELGLASIRRVAALDFDKAVFGHGKPVLASANQKLKAAFSG